MKRIQPLDSGLEYANKVDEVLSHDPRERILQEYIVCPLIQSLLDNEDVVPVDIKVSGKAHKYILYCGSYGRTKDNVLKTFIETPDLCIAKDWIWLNTEKEKNNYIATVEIKTVYSDNEFWISPGYINDKIEIENKVNDVLDFVKGTMLKKNEKSMYPYDHDEEYPKSLKKQIGIHLRGIDKVIATDGVRWIFFYKDIKDICYALSPIDLGKRICKKTKVKYKHVGIQWEFKKKFDKGKCITDIKNYELLKYVIKEFCIRKVDEMAELEEIIKRQV